MTAVAARRTAEALRLCAACGAAVLFEVLLYLSYRGHDARFHWLTHFLVGASTALILMAAWTWRTRRTVPLPLVWVLVAHLYAMVPDFVFRLGAAHYPWMEIFLGHISSHLIPGRNFTWLAVFAASLATYLCVVDRRARTDG